VRLDPIIANTALVDGITVSRFGENARVIGTFQSQ
jgi:hypothetical protein